MIVLVKKLKVNFRAETGEGKLYGIERTYSAIFKGYYINYKFEVT